MNIQIEAVDTDQAWAEMSRIRKQVLNIECGFHFPRLPEPGSEGAWHLLARDETRAVATLSVIETTGNREVHDRYGLSFGANERIARYAQLAILKPHRKRGVFETLMQVARDKVIGPNRFVVEWLLYPAALVESSPLIARFGFTARTPVLATEFGSCQALVRRGLSLPTLVFAEEEFPLIETCPI